MPTECAVSSLVDVATPQSVEVSGWDNEGQFFVEIATLELTEEGETTALLCHRVTSGSLVFVRLVTVQVGDSYEKSHRTANEAYAAEMPDFAGRCRVHLTPYQPRAARTGGDQTGATRI
jgi:hypothetical protein